MSDARPGGAAGIARHVTGARLLSVRWLGTVEYGEALKLQEDLVARRRAGDIPDQLLLLEHPHVITLGSSAHAEHVLLGEDERRLLGIGLYQTGRGGDVTYHGPGQLVGYPIFDLRSFLGPDGQRKTLGAVEYVRRLEEVLIRTCADYGIASERVKGMTGVWTCVAQLPSAVREQAKIAAIGVHISRGVTSHGFALNVTNEPLDYFQLIVPCGIASKPVTSLEYQLRTREVGATPALDEVAQAVARNLARVFNSQIVWVDTLDALLGRAVDVPARAPEELRKMAGEKDAFWA